MKKYIFGTLIILGIASPIHAQTVFPFSATLVWDTPAPEELVTSHMVNFNGSNINITPSSCNLTECKLTISIPANGTYTAIITASNLWGTSQPTTFKFTVSVPGNSRNIRIRVP